MRLSLKSHSNGRTKTQVRVKSTTSEVASHLGHPMSPGTIGQPGLSAYTGSENRGYGKRLLLTVGGGAG